MTVLQESPWYQEIFQKGVQQGIQQSVQQGMQQGMQQERQTSLLKALELRFGSVGVETQSILQTLNLEQLSELFETALTVNSLDEFQQHLSSTIGFN